LARVAARRRQSSRAEDKLRVAAVSLRVPSGRLAMTMIEAHDEARLESAAVRWAA
jgi:hypothetical protein